MNPKMIVDQDTLFLYFSGALQPEEVSEVMAWASASDENMAELLRERKLYDAIQLADDKVFEQIPRRRRRPVGQYIYRFAFGLALLAALTLALRQFTDIFPDRSLAMSSISVPAGERAQVTLPDGTSVWLNSGTTMRYPASFDHRRKREVTVDGQVYLDVARDERHPFIVHTYLADVEVHGTVFDVNAKEQDRVFGTSLFEGKVSVSLPGAADRRIFLSPDKKLTLRDNKLWISKIDDYDVYKWREGLYCFRDKHFSEIIRDLERYYGKEIVYEPDPRLEKDVLTGKFRIKDGLDYALQILQTSLRFNYSRDQENNKIYILSK